MGDKELSVDEINKLASLPSMDSLRAQLLGLLTSVQRNTVLALQGNQSGIVRLLNSNFKS
jgi:ribosomal protein L10